MVPVRRSIVIFAVLLLVRLPLLAKSNLTVSPDSALWLEGDSTLHPFASRTSQLQVTADLDPIAGGDVIQGILGKQSLKQFDLSIPVTSLKSKESGLDKNMYKALKAEACPTIEFGMKSYEVGRATASTAGLPVQALGVLRVSCHEQPVTLLGTLTPSEGVLHLQGQYALLMTDYGIIPPKMMMGAIRVKNQVVIHYDLRLVPN